MTRFFFVALLAFTLSAPSLASAGDWTIDVAHTHVGFKVRHMMVSWVRGSFGAVEGTVSYDPAAPAKTFIDVAIDVASIDTDNTKRDDHLRSPDFFAAGEHPKMTFVSTSAKPGSGGGLTVVGKLTIRGVTKEVSLAVEPFAPALKDPWGNLKTGTTATTKVNRQDFGLSWNKALETGGVVVGDEITITIDVELTGK